MRLNYVLLKFIASITIHLCYNKCRSFGNVSIRLNDTRKIEMHIAKFYLWFSTQCDYHNVSPIAWPHSIEMNEW